MSAPKKPNKKSSITKESILESARAAFLKHGYDQVGVREIACGANINCALINRYFGTKLQLFRMALNDDTDFSELFEGPVSGLGRRLAEFSVIGSTVNKAGVALSVNHEKMLMFMRSAGCVEALPVLREVLDKKMISPLLASLPEPNAREKAALITSHVFGFIVIHRIVGAACVLQADIKVVTDQFASSLQTLIDHSPNVKENL